MLFVRADAAERRPGACVHISCLGCTQTPPGRATNHMGVRGHVALQCLRILPVPVAAERAGGCAAFVPSRGWDGRATAGCLSPVAGSHMSLIGVVVIITGVRWQLRA